MMTTKKELKNKVMQEELFGNYDSYLVCNEIRIIRGKPLVKTLKTMYLKRKMNGEIIVLDKVNYFYLESTYKRTANSITLIFDFVSNMRKGTVYIESYNYGNKKENKKELTVRSTLTISNREGGSLQYKISEYENENKIVIDKNKEYIVYVIYVNTFRNPIVRISETEVEDFYDIKENSRSCFIYDNYHDQIQKTETTHNAYLVETVKEKSEILFTQSSLPKEFLKHDSEGNVIYYKNPMNQVLYENNQNGITYEKIRDIYYLYDSVVRDDRYTEFIHFCLLSKYLLTYTLFDKKTYQVIIMGAYVSCDFLKKDNYYDRIKTMIFSYDFSDRKDLFEKLEVSTNINDINNNIYFKEVNYKQIDLVSQLPERAQESVKDFVDIMSLFKFDKVTNYSRVTINKTSESINDCYSIMFDICYENESIIQVRICDKFKSKLDKNYEYDLIYINDGTNFHFRSISGIYFSHSKKEYIDNDIEVEFYEEDDKFEVKYYKSKTKIFDCNHIYVRDIFGVPILYYSKSKE